MHFELDVSQATASVFPLFPIFIFMQKEKQVEPEPVSGSGDEKDDEDLDGVPLDGAALLKSAILRGICGTTSDDSPLSESASIQASSQRSSHFDDHDIDGIPRNYSPLALGQLVSILLISRNIQLMATSMAFRWTRTMRT